MSVNRFIEPDERVRSGESGEITESDESVESGERVERGHTATKSRGQKVQDRTEESQGSCTAILSPELIQRKYKCFIIYAISFISIIELILLMFNSENSSSKNVVDVLARYVNRTQAMM